MWDSPQKIAFKKIITSLQKSPCLAFFDPSKKISISADSSSFGLGACLVQTTHDNKKEIVAYSSRLLSETERRYAQIEKEALALTWACDHFHEYITGLCINLETDHKPLLQVLQTKPIDELSPRLQRFRLRLMRYEYKIFYIPGKELLVADALSRNFLDKTHIPVDNELAEETEAHISLIVTSLPVKPYFLDQIKVEQENDEICKKLREYYLHGWPQKNKVSKEMLPYYQYRFEISHSQGFLLRGARLIIPKLLQSKCLDLIHQGHLGIVKCRSRAKGSIWWLGLSSQIENLIRNCPTCVENRTNAVEPFIRDSFPERAWQKIALDLFKFNKWYLIVTDYFSRFFEIFPLSSLTETAIISNLKQLFSRYGIPEIVRSDNGPQFQSEFKNFASKYDFKHITSSPYFAQSNGCIEAAVKIAKNLLKKNKEIDLALLSYRSTPLECGYSPAELLMGRKVRTNLPMLPTQLNTRVNPESLFNKESSAKQKSATWFNKRHRAKALSSLAVGDFVWVTDIKEYAKVVKVMDTPRSYLIESAWGTVYRRNRWHLIPAPYYTFPDTQTILPPSYNHVNEKERNIVTEDTEIDKENLATKDNANSDTKGSDLSFRGEGNAKDATNVVSPRPSRQIRRPKRLDDYVT